MSKQAKRSITVNLTPKTKALLPKSRPSVFERLGTKAIASQAPKEVCLNWAQNGTCPYGKGCKYSSTHTLISPSKQRAAKNQVDPKQRRKENGPKGPPNSAAEWGQWDPEDLADADPDDLEKRRQELQRELELQVKMESKARKKDKKVKKESSPSSESSSSSTDSSSSTESSSSSSSAPDNRHKKPRKNKLKRESSSSSDERPRKHKPKAKRTASKSATRVDKPKKPNATKSTTVKPAVAKSLSPPAAKIRKLSQTPPPKIKVTPVSKLADSKSPRPKSRSSEHNKDRHHTPSPKPATTLLVKDREKDKEKDRDKDKEKEREREKEREKEREREREREKARDKPKEKDKDKERDLKEHKKKESRSPKRESGKSGGKDGKKRDTPDSSHSRDRKASPSRLRDFKSGRRDNHKSPPPKDERKKDDKDRGRDKDRQPSGSDKPPRKDRRGDSRDRERERERERRAREAAREKEREEALARCQERQRERERLKELAKKEEEAARALRAAARPRRGGGGGAGGGGGEERDRGLDKPASDRVERLLPLPEDRVPPGAARKHSSSERDRSATRRDRGDRRDRSPAPSKYRSPPPPERRKSPERRRERDSDRNYDRTSDRSYDNRDARAAAVGGDYERDYPAPVPLRVRDQERRIDDKDYGSPYDKNRVDDRRYNMEMEDHYNENSRDERLLLEQREFPEDRRSRREHWEERELDSREIDHGGRRYGRENSHPPVPPKAPREWDAEYPEQHEWDRSRRPSDWEGRSAGGASGAVPAPENWDNPDPKHMTEEEWRLYGRSQEGWSAEDRRRWPAEWRERSRPKSSTSHNNDESSEARRKEPPPPKSDRSDAKTSAPEVPEAKKETPKRPAEEPAEPPAEPKKPCIVEPILEDNLSEISDDADEILNRDEEIAEVAAEDAAASADSSSTAAKEPSGPSAVNSVTNNSAGSQKSQSPVRSPHQNNNVLQKEESTEDENMDLDFEEISEDELEEESRVKGIGDALGVDWASLVAESRPQVKPVTSAKLRWDSHNVLVNLGMSVELAGEDLVEEVMREQSAASSKVVVVKSGDDDTNNTDVAVESTLVLTNGVVKVDEGAVVSHPVATIQVANREKIATRKNLFSSVGPNCRALSARRDLMIRRHLCNLPLRDTYIEAPKRHDAELAKVAVQLFERCL